MICLEVEVNGEGRVVAGATSAESVLASVGIYPGIKESWLRVTGDIYPNNEPVANAHWLGRQLQVGDSVTVRVVDSDSPTPATLSRTDPSVIATDSLPLVCAFCAKNHAQAQKLLLNTKTVICDECIRYLHQILVDEGLGSAPRPA